ncbi:MAG: hypothetical protein AAF387_03675 [Pseudomonadota bacterium]
MAKYTEHFHFEPAELALIERALRREISSLQQQERDENRLRARELNSLLGKIFNQKRFYSQVNETGVPAG